jgi:uncharacterized protein YhbP (UPF0306 family)
VGDRLPRQVASVGAMPRRSNTRPCAIRGTESRRHQGRNAGDDRSDAWFIEQLRCERVDVGEDLAFEFGGLDARRLDPSGERAQHGRQEDPGIVRVLEFQALQGLLVLDMGTTSGQGAPMAIKHSKRPVAASRMTALAQRLLEASTLCAIATVSADGTAHINTAYFAWSPKLDLIWLSEPRSKHSHNICTGDTAAVAVYDSNQSWGKPDRGIQLFGSASESDGAAAAYAVTVYRDRFPDYRQGDLEAYRFYVFHPSRLKLFDERELGTGRFVIARVGDSGRLFWERTDIYGTS